ncbi:MAG: N(4)-(beta-N-acetylglucosaminyl)-L-asparaginase [Planctomycetes bacterium]|nr:N(4)-(beta-N-acetylglucosaminyl)-L-asparaginase [Planctomycetota bacterium]
MADFVVIATWPFGRTAVEAAAALLRQGKPALDAAIAGAQAVEDDPKVDTVGYGGLPNAIGTVQLDACVMDGRTLACGAVAGLENVRHAAALARRVMEKTPHVLLVGEGARLFAIGQGFPLETLSTPESLAAWQKRKPAPRPARAGAPGERGSRRAAPPDGAPPGSHDTVTVLALDTKGSLGGVCSTSGLAHKLPGRVGDSPLIGAGLYVDDTAGAAGATGVGEEIIRVGGSLLLVEAMRAGKTPQEACEQAVGRVNATALRRGVHPARVAFLALDPKGRVGAACTPQTKFEYAVSRPGKTELLAAKEIGPS